MDATITNLPCNTTTGLYYNPVDMTCTPYLKNGTFSELSVLSPCDPTCNMCSGSLSSNCITDADNLSAKKLAYCSYFVPDEGTNWGNPWEGIY
jgi:hypothetical protein